MERISIKRLAISVATFAALGLAGAGPTLADISAGGPPNGPRVDCPYGPGGGYGPGTMGGYGGGYGPGMMGGYGGGFGPGMMGGGMMGMGPGLMGGYGGGYGPGMMGGYGGGFGPGMMGGGMMGIGAMFMLNLSDEQRAAITKIMDGERQQHWQIQGRMLGEQNKLRDLYESDAPDPTKVGAVFDAIAKLQREMIETHVQARNKAEQVLSLEQREQLHNWRRGRGGPGWGMGPGPGPRQQGPGGPGPMGPGYGPRGSGPGMMGP